MRGIVAATLGAVFCTMASGQNRSFENYHVEYKSDSVWASCHMAVWAGLRDPIQVSVTCSYEGGPPMDLRGLIEPVDARRLPTLLDSAGLFSGQFWGSDPRGLDGALETIAVNDGTRYALVVVTSNPTFKQGPRADLVALLRKITKAAHERGASK